MFHLHQNCGCFFQDEGDEGPEAEGEGEVEGQGEAEIESEGEPQDLEPLQGESEGERDKSSPEVEIDNQREQSEERYSESDDKEDYGQRGVTSRRHDAVESGSERSGENHYAANEDDEVNQARSHRSSFRLFLMISYFHFHVSLRDILVVSGYIV